MKRFASIVAAFLLAASAWAGSGGLPWWLIVTTNTSGTGGTIRVESSYATNAATGRLIFTGAGVSGMSYVGGTTTVSFASGGSVDVGTSNNAAWASNGVAILNTNNYIHYIQFMATKIYNSLTLNPGNGMLFGFASPGTLTFGIDGAVSNGWTQAGVDATNALGQISVVNTSYLPLVGGTMGGNISMGGHSISNSTGVYFANNNSKAGLWLDASGASLYDDSGNSCVLASSSGNKLRVGIANALGWDSSRLTFYLPANLNGNTISNGSFVGNGAGLTNLSVSLDTGTSNNAAWSSNAVVGIQSYTNTLTGLTGFWNTARSDATNAQGRVGIVETNSITPGKTNGWVVSSHAGFLTDGSLYATAAQGVSATNAQSRVGLVEGSTNALYIRGTNDSYTAAKLLTNGYATVSYVDAATNSTMTLAQMLTNGYWNYDSGTNWVTLNFATNAGTVGGSYWAMSNKVWTAFSLVGIASESDPIFITWASTSTNWMALNTNRVSVDSTFATNWIYTNVVNSTATNAYTIATNAQGRVGVVETNSITPGQTNGWVVSSHSGNWNTAYTDSQVIKTNYVTKGQTNGWATAMVDASSATNWMATNGYVKVESDTLATVLARGADANSLGITNQATTSAFTNGLLVATMLASNVSFTASAGTTVAAMQATIDSIPKNLNGKTATFNFGAGTFTIATGAGLFFDSFSSGYINIKGANTGSGPRTNHTSIIDFRTSAASHVIEVTKCTASMTIQDLYLWLNSTNGQYGIYTLPNPGYTTIQDCYFRGNVDTSGGVGVAPGGGPCVIARNVFMRMNVGIWAFSSAVVQDSANCYTSAIPNYGRIASYGAIILRQDATVIGTLDNTVQNGSIINTNFAGKIL